MSVLDLSTFVWQEVFDPTFREYKVPTVISKVIGGEYVTLFLLGSPFLLHGLTVFFPMVQL